MAHAQFLPTHCCLLKKHPLMVPLCPFQPTSLEVGHGAT